MQSGFEYDVDIYDEEIPSEVFSFKESLRARFRELRHSVSLLKRSPLFIFGFFTIMFLVALAVFAPFITNFGPSEFAIDDILHVNYIKQPPGWRDKVTKQIAWSEINDLSTDFGIDPNLAVRSCIVDLNNDSLEDILVGTNSSQLLFYENIGSDDPVNPNKWTLSSTLTFPTIPENITGLVSPAAGDINNDSVTDVVIGGNDGKIYQTLNNGTPGSPEWTDFSLMYDIDGEELRYAGQAHPTLVDYNHDNQTDLVIGSSDYAIDVYLWEYDVFQRAWGFELQSNMPKDIKNRKLSLDGSYGSGGEWVDTPLGSGSVRVNFIHIKPDSVKYWDIAVIFDSGDYEFFTATDIVSNPNYVMLDKSKPSARFDFPIVEAEISFDFLFYDYIIDVSAGNITFETEVNQSEFIEGGENQTEIIKLSRLLEFKPGGTVVYSFQFLEEDGRVHYFGTDQQGGDIYSRCIWALQTDLILAIWVVAIAVVIGTIIGAIAGYFGGWIDQLIMRITDVFFAFPGLILAMAIAAALGRSMFNLSIALIAVWWAGYARIARGQVISEKSRLYVEAARAVGLGNSRIIFRHVLPNSIYPLLVAATLDLGGVVLTAAGLSFIGFGANPGDAELGRMIADGRDYFIKSPWLVFFPGFFIFLIVLAFNLIGDGIRDVMDPKLRR
ncbi:MAG: ABC transporter permease subunit [Candidatus Heimdallarchaeota archaeon]|nr:MAG: ABC transporter permease subunit [Candidatus Heimdallarchaeota archaeon]